MAYRSASVNDDALPDRPVHVRAPFVARAYGPRGCGPGGLSVLLRGADTWRRPTGAQPTVAHIHRTPTVTRLGCALPVGRVLCGQNSDYRECQLDCVARRLTRVIRNPISRPTRRPRSMSDRVQGNAVSVTTVPRPADPYEGPESPSGPQPFAPQVTGISREGTVPRPSVPRPSIPRPPVPRPPAPVSTAPRSATPALVTSWTAEVRQPHPSASPSRASVRDEFDAVLSGVPLSTRDRQFLGKLVHWDKRKAASVVYLLRRARRAGRNEAGLTPVQLETVLAALKDAVVHRVAGVDTVGCWDCDKVRGGRCAEHSRDFERARGYADLAALLSAGSILPHLDNDCATGLAPTPIQRPTDISGYRRRAPIVS